MLSYFDYNDIPVYHNTFTISKPSTNFLILPNISMKKIKYCGNTSNLRSHLERALKKEFQALLNVKAEKAKEKGESSASNQQSRISKF